MILAQQYYRDPLGGDPPQLDELEGVFAHLLSAVLVLAGLAALLALIGGGLRYLTAGGDEKAVGDAKKAITLAVAGVVVVAMAYLVLYALGGGVFGNLYFGPGGSNLIQFTIPKP